MKKDKNSYLEDSCGNHSSKRLFASFLVSVGMVMGVSLFCLSIFKGDSTTALKTIEFFFFSGCGLLGISVTERFFDKRRD